MDYFASKAREFDMPPKRRGLLTKAARILLPLLISMLCGIALAYAMTLEATPTSVSQTEEIKAS